MRLSTQDIHVHVLFSYSSYQLRVRSSSLGAVCSCSTSRENIWQRYSTRVPASTAWRANVPRPALAKRDLFTANASLPKGTTSPSAEGESSAAPLELGTAGRDCASSQEEDEEEEEKTEVGEGGVVEEAAVAAEATVASVGFRIDNIGNGLATTVASMVTTTSTRYPTRELMVERGADGLAKSRLANPSVQRVRERESPERRTCVSTSAQIYYC